MNVNDKDQNITKQKTEKLKLYAAIVLVMLGVISFNLELAKFNVYFRLITLVTFLLLAAMVLYFSVYTSQFLTFFKEARFELRRVFWPSLPETRQMIIAVMIVIFLTIIYLMIVDGLLRLMIQWLISFR